MREMVDVLTPAPPCHAGDSCGCSPRKRRIVSVMAWSGTSTLETLTARTGE